MSSHTNGPRVTLPGGSGRGLELLHTMAWRELLAKPGAAAVLARYAAHSTAAPSSALAEGASVELSGRCGADLFLVCDACHADRMVIEVKGPGAWVNWQRSACQWQTICYRAAYQSNPARACHLAAGGQPVLVFLDARNRTARQIEEKETYGEQIFDGWAVLTYEQVLADTRFAGDEHAAWLLNAH